MGASTVGQIVKEVVNVIWEVLHPIHMKVPDESDFLKITDDFKNLWDFPNCIGSIDGKHVRVQSPAHSGTMYYNYKNFFSIVLQALVDANYKFICIDVGGYGKQSDGGTFRASNLFLYLTDGRLKIPEACALPNSDIIAPFVIIGDEAYPLLPNLLKPYSRKRLDADKEYFNARLSRARRTVECAFGIIYSKWKILATSIQTAPTLADVIIKCICLLHNVIIDREGIEHHLTQNWTLMPRNIVTNQTVAGQQNQTAENIRNVFKLYFCHNPI
uniref:Putative nuclease HARBI1 n=1 Tax=Bactrocera latifrons TaxID=174628 RepID=A0A0K8UY09_BACLA